MQRETAMGVAQEVLAWLTESCTRVTYAGSLRRRADEVKDVEIVYVPKLVPTQNTLFEMHESEAVEPRLFELIEQGALRRDQAVKRWGSKYKRVIHVRTGAVVELFRADPANWGLIFALRTGPADYMKMVVSHGWEGGVMPPKMKMDGGYLWRNGERLDTPEERDFFEALGLPWWPPKQRTADRLRTWSRLCGPVE